jgi:hypothetical protein
MDRFKIVHAVARQIALVIGGLFAYVIASGPLVALSILMLHLTGSGFLYGPMMLFYTPLLMADESVMHGYGTGPFESYIQWCLQVTGAGVP